MLDKDRIENVEINAKKQVEAAKRKAFRNQTKHIKAYLEEATFIKPGSTLTMGRIRTYCVANNKIDKKEKMTLTENNVVEKWSAWFPESVGGVDSDTD